MRYVTIDETWIHYYTFKSNQASAGEVLASVFWDAHGTLSIDYLETGGTINSEYYMALLIRLKEESAKKRPQMKKKVLFHKDNAPWHKSIATMVKLHELHFEFLPILRIVRIWLPATITYLKA